jgi:16S rRNA (uracil1498-N3)-methyltransferase
MEADHRAPRLYVDDDLKPERTLTLSRDHSHYLLNVMRCRTGTVVRLFNGRDGEWAAELLETSRKQADLVLRRLMRPQVPLGRISWLFAPLKQARLDYMVQKAVEMGVASLQPVLTQHTMVQRLNLDRMRANAIEAAEQCHLLAIPAILPEMKLDKALAELPQGTSLVFCDEGADLASPIEALKAVPADRPVAVLIGPEGGFSEKERQSLLNYAGVIRLSLGPRIMRADTAAVAALTLVQAVCGDLA